MPLHIHVQCTVLVYYTHGPFEVSCLHFTVPMERTGYTTCNGSHSLIDLTLDLFCRNICSSFLVSKIESTKKLIQDGLLKKFHAQFLKKKIAMKNELNIHMNNHSDTQKFTCSVCQREFSIKNEFERHMNNHNETSYEEMSLISNTEDSLWKFVSCEKYSRLD